MGLFKKPNADPYASAGYYDAEPVSNAPSPVTAPSEKAPGSTLNIGGGNMELKIVYPKSFDDVSTIADHLLNGCTVFLNLETTDRQLCRRILDFVIGVAYCIDGNIKKVSNGTYVISPSSVDVTETEQLLGSSDPEF